MKDSLWQFQKRRGGFSSVELVVMIVLVTVLFFLFAGRLSSRPRTKAPLIKCVNNLKNLGLGLRIRVTDNEDLFPFAHLVTNPVERAKLTVADYFKVLTNEMSTPKILYCPADRDRKPAADWGQFAAKNISYFANLVASETNMSGFLAGDRNLSVNGREISNEALTVATNDTVQWSAKLHSHKGNVLMGDGSVQIFDDTKLQQGLRNSRIATNYFLFP